MSDYYENFVIQVDRRREIHTQFYITYEALLAACEKFRIKVDEEDKREFAWEDKVLHRLLWWAKQRNNEAEVWEYLEQFASPRTMRDISNVQGCKVSKSTAKSALGIN